MNTYYFRNSASSRSRRPRPTIRDTGLADSAALAKLVCILLYFPFFILNPWNRIIDMKCAGCDEVCRLRYRSFEPYRAWELWRRVSSHLLAQRPGWASSPDSSEERHLPCSTCLTHRTQTGGSQDPSKHACIQREDRRSNILHI